MKRVSPDEAHALMREGYAYIDVRSEPEFDVGHPASAFNVPWLEASTDGMRPNPHFIAELRASFGFEAKLVVGCKTATRAEQAALAMESAGFRDVVLQRAGFDGLADPFGRIKEQGWRARSLPVELDARPGHDHASLSARAVAPDGQED